MVTELFDAVEVATRFRSHILNKYKSILQIDRSTFRHTILYGDESLEDSRITDNNF